MSLPQAVTLALLITVGVTSLTGLVWRSTSGDRTASRLLGLLNALSTLVLILAGTTVLLLREPNIFVAAGVAVASFANALKRAMTWREWGERWTMIRVLRIQWSGNIAAGTLCAIGSVLYGGSVGTLGFLVALCWTFLYVWLIRRVPTEPQSPA